MSKFKPGDKVVVIAGPQKGEKVRTLKQYRYHYDSNYQLLIGRHAYTNDGRWSVHSIVCLRHATPEEIAKPEKCPCSHCQGRG